MYCKVMKRCFSGMLLFALVLAFGAPASTNLLYTAQTYYSNTKLGKIDVDTAMILTFDSIGGDWGQGIFPFRDAQNRNRVTMTLYQGGADTIKILDPLSFSWSTPVATVSNDAKVHAAQKRYAQTKASSPVAKTNENDALNAVLTH